MKTSLFACFFGLLIVARVHGQSNQTSSYTITIPNDGSFAAIANQLDHGSNRLNEVLSNVPDNTILLKWDCAAQDWSSTQYTYNLALHQWSANGTLAPGEGGLILLGGGGPNPYPLTFTGTPHVPVLPPVFPCGYGQYSLLSRQTNDIGTYDNITGLAPAQGARFRRWNIPLQDFDTYTFSNGAWSPSVPSLNIGESALISVPQPILLAYTNHINTGSTLIANQLDHGSNTLFDLFPPSTLPDGIYFTIFSQTVCGSSNTYYYESGFPGDGWATDAGGSVPVDPRTVSLPPGTAAMVLNTAGAFDLIFTGTPHVPVLPPNLPCGYGSWYMLGRQTNDLGTYENVTGLAPQQNAQVQRWNGSGYDIYSFLNGAWVPTTPALNIGEAARFFIPGPCPAQPLVLFNTGVGTNGVALPTGSVDPHYGITSSPTSSGSNAFAVTGNGLTNTSASKWIGPSTNGGGVNGTYSYQMTFDLPCTNDVLITGRWAVDNDGAIVLNGAPNPVATLSGGGSGNFATWHSFTINSGLAPGQNTLTFYVTNATGPTALRVELSGSATCCCVEPPAGMVAWYPMEEPTGATAITDVAGYNNQATPRPGGSLGAPNGPTPASGEVGGALFFGNNDLTYLETPDHPELNFGAGDLTIDAWVKIPGTGFIYETPIVEKMDRTVGAGKGYYFYAQTDCSGQSGYLSSLRLDIGDGATLASYVFSCLVPNEDIWHHVAVTVDRTSGVVTFYLDGVGYPTSSPALPAGSTDNTLPLLIRATGVQTYWGPIFIDELELFNRALTGAEIQSISKAGILGKCKSPCPPQALVLYGTGTDSNGVALANGEVDPHYALVNNPNGGGSNAYVITGNGLPNTATSKWIGPTTSGAGVAGTYAYQMTFNLPCTNNAVISGRWAVDNNGAILLNGDPNPVATLTGGGSGNFATWHSFTINSGLAAGQNTLTFYVTNAAGPTALRVELSGNAACCCPPTNLVILNTGYDHVAGSVYPLPTTSSPDVKDAFWTVIADPDPGTTESRPANVISAHPAWAAAQSGSQWISSYRTAEDDLNGPYDFQTRFCLEPGWTNVVMSLCMRADDRAEVYLNGSLILTGPNPGFRAGGLACVTINNPASFTTGPNVLKVRVYNIYSVAMGLNLTGTVTGSGVALDKPACCQPASSLAGRKFDDLNGNGARDPGEPPLSNWTIQLSNGDTTTTDANGYYYFLNLSPGTYVINEVQQTGWIQTKPASSGGTYVATLGTAQSIGGLDFGNHYSETNCVQIVCHSNIVAECQGDAGTPVPFSVDASSTCGRTVTVVCTPASPGPFPSGATTVHCVATDTQGETASCDFRVFVVDNTPPVITCPTNIVVESCTNVLVSYVVNATDTCSSNVIVVCTPPSPSWFPPGTTTVDCVATDAAGHTNSCSFTVTVAPATQLLSIFDTGVDASGTVLAGGAIDPHYTLSTNPNGGGANAYVVNPVIPGWAPDTLTSKWIGPAINGSGIGGTYAYKMTFNLPCTNQATVTGSWAVDNDGVILLNGSATPVASLTGGIPSNFSTLHPFNIVSGLSLGQNTLMFYVTNNAGATGLRVELSGSAKCCCYPLYLEASSSVTGPYAVDASAVIDQNAMTITTPKSGSASFYRLRSGCSARIVSIVVVGSNVIMTYTF